MKKLLIAILITCAQVFGMQDGIQARLANKDVANVHVSIAAIDVESGEWVYALGAERPMVPASNMKLVTTAAALSVLGPERVFTTHLYGSGPIDSNGVLQGDLIVVGGGDPCLRGDLLAPGGLTDPAAELAESLRDAGVRGIAGDLLVDSSFFDATYLHNEWELSDREKWYAAPISGLSIHRNCLTVEYDGHRGLPSARIATSAKGYSVSGTIKGAMNSNEFKVGALRPDENLSVRVFGSMGTGVGPERRDVPVVDPARFFGACLHEQIDRMAIDFEGNVRLDPGVGKALNGLQELVRFETPLSLAVMVANKESDNSIAEHLFKHLGQSVMGVGSFEAASMAVESYIEDTLDIDTEGMVIRDGSGLSPSNRLTAGGVASVLFAMAHEPDETRDVFLRSLPVGGRDGTMAKRLTEGNYPGKVRAKTGYIRGAYALSGYVWTRMGRWLCFSILINAPPDGNRVPYYTAMKSVMDDVCRVLIDDY